MTRYISQLCKLPLGISTPSLDWKKKVENTYEGSNRARTYTCLITDVRLATELANIHPSLSGYVTLCHHTFISTAPNDDRH